MSLIVFLAVCLLAGYTGSRYTFLSVKTWYTTIKKPSWNPPNGVFASVWTLLYIMMAVSAWMVWEKAPGAPSRGPMLLFALQLLLNVAWSAIFFGMRDIRAAFKEIMALWLAVTATMVVFWSITPLAGALFVPYVLWVSFAAYLNYTIYKLNHEAMTRKGA